LSAIQATLASNVDPCYEVIDNAIDTEVYEHPIVQPSISPTDQKIDPNRAVTRTANWSTNNQIRTQRLLHDSSLNKSLPLEPIIIRVLVCGDRPLKNELSELTIFEGDQIALRTLPCLQGPGAVIFDASSMDSPRAFIESSGDSDTEVLFDLAVVNLGVRNSSHKPILVLRTNTGLALAQRYS